MRVAAYDRESGRARIFEWEQGAELRAARCAVGCMGIILSVTLRCVPKYMVAETVRRHATIDDVLAREEAYPLQQFILVPHLWSFFAFHRRAAGSGPRARRTPGALLYRAYNRVVGDVAFHLLVRGIAAPLATPAAVRAFYRHAFRWFLLRGPTVVDQSHHVLTLRHDLFRHLEMEVFLPARHVRAATAVVRDVVAAFAGDPGPAPEGTSAVLRAAGVLEALERHRGTYAHHYPLFFRRVLPDDTLVSMASGSEAPYYTISFFTYQAPHRRAPFFAMADYLAHVLSRCFDARLHWGKYIPLAHHELARLYPSLGEFRELCDGVDPGGVFRNAYTSRVLGLGEPAREAPAPP
jgi:hypothetical protein